MVFIATFGYNQIFENRAIKIIADDEETARKCMLINFNNRYAFLYTLEEWEGYEELLPFIIDERNRGF